MLKRLFLTLLIVFYLSPCLFGNNAIDLNIRFFNKTLYTTESDIQIKIELKNQGNRPYHFKVADYKEYNLLFRVMDMRNREVPLSDNFNALFQSSQPYFYRDVSLQPGEEFSFVVGLPNFVNLNEPGEYLVEALFYPELHNMLGNHGEPLVSNRIILSLRPDMGDSMIFHELAAANEEILRAESLSPDEVIKYTLEARQLDQWEPFFLYINLNSILRQNPLWERQFIQSNEDEQQAILMGFKEDLKAGQILEFQNFIEKPDRFEILHTAYNQNDATVRVREYFLSNNRDFTIIRDYQYFLVKENGIWKINRYQVSNVGTE